MKLDFVTSDPALSGGAVTRSVSIEVPDDASEEQIEQAVTQLLVAYEAYLRGHQAYVERMHPDAVKEQQKRQLEKMQDQMRPPGRKR